MSLAFDAASTDTVSHGTAVPAHTSCSYAAWMYFTDLTNLRWMFYVFTGSFQAPGLSLRDPSAAELGVAWRRGGGNTLYVTNNASLTTNKWWYVAFTFTQTGPDIQVYVGDLSTLATARTFGTTTNGSGAYASNSGATFGSGDISGGSQTAGARIATLMYWPDVVLTEAQFQAQQFRFVPLIPGCEVFSHYGYGGATTQADWTGHGHTGTGSGVAVADHVPLPIFGFDVSRSYSVSAQVLRRFLLH